MTDEVIEEAGTAEDAVAGHHGRAQGILALALGLHDFAAHVGGGSRQPQGNGFLGDAELLVEVVNHRSAVGVQDQTLDGTDTVELQSGLEIATELGQALVDHILDRLQLALAAEGAQVLDGVRQQGVAGFQVRHDEGAQVACIAVGRLHRLATLAHRHQADLALVVFDGDGGGGDAFFLEQAQSADTARLVILLVDGGGQAGDAEGVVVENVHVSHEFVS
ncbi:hypothetical protein FQZ97_894450 [compost metagenome]